MKGGPLECLSSYGVNDSLETYCLLSPLFCAYWANSQFEEPYFEGLSLSGGLWLCPSLEGQPRSIRHDDSATASG